jgi:hypothetical protein
VSSFSSADLPNDPLPRVGYQYLYELINQLDQCMNKPPFNCAWTMGLPFPILAVTLCRPPVIAQIIIEGPMSAFGYKRTLAITSAYSQKQTLGGFVNPERLVCNVGTD